MKNKCICYTPYLRNSNHHEFWYTYVNSPNDKKFCSSCSISQEPCIIWLSFMVHMWKMIIPPVFSFFQNFDFLGCQWGKSAKNGPKWQKILFVTLHISGTIQIWLSFMKHMCKTILSPDLFFIFSKFWFSGS